MSLHEINQHLNAGKSDYIKSFSATQEAEGQAGQLGKLFISMADQLDGMQQAGLAEKMDSLGGLVANATAAAAAGQDHLHDVEDTSNPNLLRAIQMGERVQATFSDGNKDDATVPPLELPKMTENITQIGIHITALLELFRETGSQANNVRQRMSAAMHREVIVVEDITKYQDVNNLPQ